MYRFHQDNRTALILAADNGKADIVSLLLAAGADIEARNNVSKRISICLAHVCVCVCVLYSSAIVYDK